MQNVSDKKILLLSTLMLFIAGFVDINAFVLGGRLLIVYMGGNITNFNYSIFTFDLYDILKFGGIIVTFASGSFLGSFIKHIIKKLYKFFIMEIILGFVALICSFFIDWYCFYILCFMIGYQNALKYKIKEITISESFITSIVSGFGYFSARRLLKKEDGQNFHLLVFKISMLFIGNVIGFSLIFLLHLNVHYTISIIILLYVLLFFYTKSFKDFAVL